MCIVMMLFVDDVLLKNIKTEFQVKTVFQEFDGRGGGGGRNARLVSR